MDVKSTWIPTWHHMDHVSWSLGPGLAENWHLVPDEPVEFEK